MADQLLETAASADMIQVRIKSASNRCEDLEINSVLSSTVKQLKEKIRQNYPLHPDTRDQRLIFAGHLLEDTQTLREVLLPNSEASQKSFTLHLVCNAKNPRPMDHGYQNKYAPRNDMPLSASVPPVNLPTNAEGNPAPNPNMMGMPPEIMNYQEYVQNMLNAMNQNQWAQYNPYFYNPYGPGMFYPPNQPNWANPPPNQPPMFNNNRQMEEAAVAAAQAQNNQVQQQQRERDDEEQPRDLLDWMYTFSRIVLIFSVVYFYANFTRFALVVVVTSLIMIFQRRQGQQQQANRVAAPAAPPAAPVNPEGNEQDIPRGEGEEAEPLINREPGQNAGDTPRVVEALPQQNRNVAWAFVTTFFTSLIPEVHPN